jgi:hypothetical protein
VYCCAGHPVCLAYLLQNGCPISDSVLDLAVCLGQYTSVVLLVAHGLPRMPYLRKTLMHGAKPDGLTELRCLQHLISKGCPIHPGTLISAAIRGDVACMRFLHERGVPFWERAWEVEDDPDKPPNCRLPLVRLKHCMLSTVCPIPQAPEDEVLMYTAMRYASCMGAPVTPSMEKIFRDERAATRAVLLSFHVATRMGQGKGIWKQGAALGGMARMPPELIEKVLVHADFDIPKSLGRSLSPQRSVRVLLSGPHPRWAKVGGIKEYAILIAGKE